MYGEKTIEAMENALKDIESKIEKAKNQFLVLPLKFQYTKGKIGRK